MPPQADLPAWSPARKLSKIFLILIPLFFAGTGIGQDLYNDLPGKIRGYKVHSERIIVSTDNNSKSEQNSTETIVNIGEPLLVKASLTGITFELPAEIKSGMQSGKVDLITFYDIQVNGIPVNVDEYKKPFALRRGETVTLPEPASIFLPTGRILQAAWYEMREKKEEWHISGRAFVFGKFRKYGFYHKRVVPIDIDIMIPNPVM